MTWEPRPLPVVTPETEAFWSAAVRGELSLRACNDCGLVHYYPRANCPDCLSDNVEWRAASGRGTVYSYSVAERISGWPENELPVILAYVELEEGPRVMTNIVDCDPADVSVGDDVVVTFEPTDEEAVAIPVFTLAGD